MKLCEHCVDYKKCFRDYKPSTNLAEHCDLFEKIKQTNFDRIKAMSVEELAQFMNECGHDFPPYCNFEMAVEATCDQNCTKCAIQWLESEVVE